MKTVTKKKGLFYYLYFGRVKKFQLWDSEALSSTTILRFQAPLFSLAKI